MAGSGRGSRTCPVGIHDDEGDCICVSMKEIVGDSGVIFIGGGG